MTTPREVLDAAQRLLGAISVDHVSYTENRHEWIAWLRQHVDMGGGPRLVIPKNGTDPFIVSSGLNADTRNGVSDDYLIYVVEPGHSFYDACNVLHKFTSLPRADCLRLLKNSEMPKEEVFIAEPLLLMEQLRLYGFRVKLIRSGGRGSYDL